MQAQPTVAVGQHSHCLQQSAALQGALHPAPEAALRLQRLELLPRALLRSLQEAAVGGHSQHAGLASSGCLLLGSCSGGQAAAIWAVLLRRPPVALANQLAPAVGADVLLSIGTAF